MSKITLDNLSDNLKVYLEGLGLTEEQVKELVLNAEKIIMSDGTTVEESITEIKEAILNLENNVIPTTPEFLSLTNEYKELLTKDGE